MANEEMCGGLTEELNFAITEPGRLKERLKAQGIDVTLEQALQIVELLDQLSNIIIAQHLRSCK